MADETRRSGAYGLHLPDLADAGPLLTTAPADWPTWRISVDVLPEEDLRERVEPTQVLSTSELRCSLSNGGWAVTERASRRTTLSVVVHPGPGSVLHPLFSVSAAAAAMWRGDVALHASALLGDHGCWGLLGTHGSGKSSTVAAWAEAGRGVMTDDVLVVRDGHALAGPRMIDLRNEAAPRHPTAVDLGRVGKRERWRMQLPAVEPECPLSGFVTLAWGPDLTLEPVPLTDRLAILEKNLTLGVPSLDPLSLAVLCTLPMHKLTRPQDERRISDVLHVVAEQLDTSLA